MNVHEPLPVKSMLVGVIHVSVSLYPVSVAMTPLLVKPVVLYTTLAVGAVVSIIFIVLVVDHVFPATST